MAKIEDIKFTVELDEADRKRIDTLIECLKAPRVIHLGSPYRDLDTA